MIRRKFVEDYERDYNSPLSGTRGSTRGKRGAFNVKSEVIIDPPKHPVLWFRENALEIYKPEVFERPDEDHLLVVVWPTWWEGAAEIRYVTEFTTYVVWRLQDFEVLANPREGTQDRYWFIVEIAKLDPKWINVDDPRKLAKR